MSDKIMFSEYLEHLCEKLGFSNLFSANKMRKVWIILDI